ncbi:hypothetical protein M0802_011067 [Mischocyttarus mexicanus]|nr:hypothetical protein M0802_011067 [Mischocyttarus mexicanus]
MHWTSADDVFEKFDINKDGFLDIEEFYLLCKELFDDVKNNRWRVLEIFQKFNTCRNRGLKGSDWRRCYTEWITPILEPVNVLVVVDVQNDFIRGSLALSNCKSGNDGYEVIEPINRILSKVQWDHVIYTLDYHPEDHISFYDNLDLRELHPSSRGKKNISLYDTVTFLEPHVSQTLWPKHCIMGTWGSELHKDLIIFPNAIQICKGQKSTIEAYSAFTRDKEDSISEMEKVLINVKATNLYICGLALDVCVRYTCLDALKLGYKVTLIEDCCRGIDNDQMKEAIKCIQEKGGLVTNSDKVFTHVNEWKRSLVLAHFAAKNLPDFPVESIQSC